MASFSGAFRSAVWPAAVRLQVVAAVALLAIAAAAAGGGGQAYVAVPGGVAGVAAGVTLTLIGALLVLGLAVVAAAGCCSRRSSCSR